MTKSSDQRDKEEGDDKKQITHTLKCSGREIDGSTCFLPKSRTQTLSALQSDTDLYNICLTFTFGN